VNDTPLFCLFGAALFLLVCSCTNDTEEKCREPFVELPGSSISAEFLYLPDSTVRHIGFSGDSVFVKLFQFGDTCTSRVSVHIDSIGSSFRDSIAQGMSQLSSKTYQKSGVIDGTKMWLRGDRGCVFCNNCLHDYVMEAVGVGSPGGFGGDLRYIKNIVAWFNEASAAAEAVIQRSDTAKGTIKDLKDLYKRSYDMQIQFPQKEPENTRKDGEGKNLPE